MLAARKPRTSIFRSPGQASQRIIRATAGPRGPEPLKNLPARRRLPSKLTRSVDLDIDSELSIFAASRQTLAGRHWAMSTNRE